MPDESDEYWNRFKATLQECPLTADSIVQMIYLARESLPRNEQPLLDDLINALHPYTFFARAAHHVFWMWVRGILPKEHHPFYAAGSDMFCPSDIKDEQPPRNYLQEITDELAAIRIELERLKAPAQRKTK
jgi:hypothetical protein